jgi:phage terminase small subunit
MALTNKHRKFIDEYLKDMNASAAAERAGYAPATARQQGSRLLTNADIQNEIKRRQAIDSSKSAKTREQIMNDLETVINMYLTAGKLTNNALKAIEILNRMKGWNEPDKAVITHKGLTINYVKPNDKDSEQGDN